MLFWLSDKFLGLTIGSANMVSGSIWTALSLQLYLDGRQSGIVLGTESSIIVARTPMVLLVGVSRHRSTYPYQEASLCLHG